LANGIRISPGRVRWEIIEFTSSALGMMTRLIPEVLSSLQILELDGNGALLNANPAQTQRFAKVILPRLTELRISGCGEDSVYIPIINTCEADNVDKLELLDVLHERDPSQAMRNQLIKSLPKMRIKRMRLGDELLHHSDRALMSAFCKNTSIIEPWHTMIDYETSRRISSQPTLMAGPRFVATCHHSHSHNSDSNHTVSSPPPSAVTWSLASGFGRGRAGQSRIDSSV
jgi:hypothetical protein